MVSKWAKVLSGTGVGSVLLEALPPPLLEEVEKLVAGDVDERFAPAPVLPPDPPALPVEAVVVVELRELPVLAPALDDRLVVLLLAAESCVGCVAVAPEVDDGVSVETAPPAPPVDVRPVVVVVVAAAAA